MESDKKTPKRSKAQVSFQFRPEVEKWVEDEEYRTGMSRTRLGIAAIIAYEMQGLHQKSIVTWLSTAVDQGRITLDEAIAFFQVVEPAIHSPSWIDVPHSPHKEHFAMQLMELLNDSFIGFAGSKAKYPDAIAELRKNELRYAEYRRAEAIKRVKAKFEAEAEAAKKAVAAGASVKPKRVRQRREGEGA